MTAEAPGAPDYRAGEEKTFEDLVAASLATVPPKSSFEGHVSACEGAFPSVVLQQLQKLGRVVRFPTPKNFRDSDGPRPELHPLDYEWYFTDDTASLVASLIGNASARLLCLGTPTVAAALSAAGKSSTLVDRNPLTILRLARGPGVTTIEPTVTDLATFPGFSASFDAAIFDAPWYFDTFLLWLWHATRAVRPGGRIVFPLFKRLLRPSAAAELREIHKTLNDLGDVRVLPDVVCYQTPLFEQVALQKTGISGLGNWRKADLAVLDIRRSLSSRPHVPADDKWATFIFGRQVIKVRMAETNRRPTDQCLLAPVEGYRDFTYDSVSRRDAARANIGLWTSRNRIAQVSRPQELCRVLSIMCDHVGPVNSFEAISFSLQRTDRNRLRKVLDLPQ
jgi:hypothetical protein